MLKIENTEVVGLEAAIRGMRNPMNSWDKSDSGRCLTHSPANCADCVYVNKGCNASDTDFDTRYIIGPNDLDLMTRLCNAGTDHRKFMRMIVVYLDITAPLYWWKEFDTYKVGTVANSCSTMHKIADKEFDVNDFSHEHIEELDGDEYNMSYDWLLRTADILNYYRKKYNTASEKLNRDITDAERKHVLAQQKLFWWQMIQLLPSSYNQRRTIMLNYEVLGNIYKSRWNHKLDEWHTFCDWIETLPYSELITGKERGKRAMRSVLDDFNVLGNIYAVSPEEIRKACEVKENDK